ncbi:MAG TPA: GGDEF domain-containing protein [Nitrobacter sp.]|jgi:diguanylate cyclase (GGDEF)-like protein|nr:GGDEF domain-containing protein [Nitrobacter sp.]
MKKRSKVPPSRPAKRSAGPSVPRKRQRTALAATAAPKQAAAAASAAADSKAVIRRLRMQLAAAHARIADLEASAETDFLLGIFNRRGFMRELDRSVAYIRRYGASGALIMLDVDRLKPINDAYGHAAGDEVLKAVAATLSQQIRASDVIGRLGGDEFALLLWNMSETDAAAKAAALEDAIDQLAFRFRGHAVTTGASAGVAVLTPHADASRVLEAADSAMYVRKAQRRGG